MSYGNPLIFTYSSGFGALALQIKQVRENFCSNWISLDWGKREWPPIGTIGEGGFRGVKNNSEVVSKICTVTTCMECQENIIPYCKTLLKKSSNIQSPAIINSCKCKFNNPRNYREAQGSGYLRSFE